MSDHEHRLTARIIKGKDGEMRTKYVAWCVCGWRGPERAIRETAGDDSWEHQYKETGRDIDLEWTN